MKKKIRFFLLIGFILFLFSGCSTRISSDSLNLTGAIQWDGLKRTYTLHLPPSFERENSLPLVIALHGSGSSGERFAWLTKEGFNKLADKEKFIVVYPDGVEKNWNDGRTHVSDRAHRENIDDVGFVSALMDKLIEDFNIDSSHIYVTGISNGGGLTYRLACELTSRLRGVAPVALPMPEDLAKACSPSKPLPILIIHGDSDPIVPYNGGWIAGMSGKVLSIEDTVKYWISNNGCPETPEKVEEIDRDPLDGTSVKKTIYCSKETEVAMYTIEGGGHTWPGGVQYRDEAYIGKTSSEIDACEVIWAFFESH